MINEPGTRIIYDGDPNRYVNDLAVVFSLVKRIRSEQLKYNPSGRFERNINNLNIKCTFGFNLTTIYLSKPLITKEKEEILVSSIENILIFTLVIVEPNTTRRWDGSNFRLDITDAAQSVFDYFDIALAACTWDPVNQETSEIVSKELTFAQYEPIYNGFVSLEALNEHYLSIVPELGISGKPIVTYEKKYRNYDPLGSDAGEPRDPYMVSPNDLYDILGPRYVTGMITIPNVSMPYMSPYPIDYAIEFQNKYEAEYCWGPLQGSTYDTVLARGNAGYGNNITYDVGTCSDLICYDYTTGHDWRIDSLLYQPKHVDSYGYICHTVYGTFSGSHSDYNYGAFAWDTRFGMMFNGYTLTSDFHSNIQAHDGPHISDFNWSQWTIEPMPWLVSGVIFDAVSINSGVIKGPVKPALDTDVPCGGFWNLRGCCEIYDVPDPNNPPSYLDLTTSDTFTSSIGNIFKRALEETGANILDPLTLPNELVVGIGGLDVVDFRAEAGVVYSDKCFQEPKLLIYPISNEIKEVING